MQRRTRTILSLTVAALMGVALAASHPAAAQGDTEYTVSNLNDAGPGSLRAAVAAANANSGVNVIHFANRLHGAISLTSGELDITGSMVIDGPGAQKLTVSGSGLSRIFEIDGSATEVAISGLTLANGLASGVTFVNTFNTGTYGGDFLGPNTAGGAIFNNGGSLTLSDVTLTHNQAVDPSSTGVFGGAIANVFGGSLTVTDCTFSGNMAGAGSSQNALGGAIENMDGSSAVIKHSTFTGNLVTSPGDVALNLGYALGGGIDNFEIELRVSSCTFDNNRASSSNEGFGGAISALEQDPGTHFTLTVTDSTFTGNLATGWGLGGAIFVGGGYESLLSVSHSTFTGNQARGDEFTYGDEAGTFGPFGAYAQGGAILQGGVPTIISDSNFTDNAAIAGYGGDSTVIGNGGNGGAGNQGVGGAIFGAPCSARY